MDAAQALADLTEISSQIEAAVLASADGSVIASTFPDEERAKRFAASALELLGAAEESARESSSRLAQLEGATPEGSVFVVRDERHVVAAATGAQPTVGLVFYDLRTCLRLLEREEAEKAAKTPKRRTTKKKEVADEA